MRDYAVLLKESGLKATFQRMIVLEAVDKNGHMSIEEIYEEVVHQHPSISLATIYKNIILLLEKSVLTEVPIVGKKSKYELSKTDHIHLICSECGEVKDKSCLESTNKTLHAVTDQEHFRLHKRQINLYGVCEACQV